MLSIATHISRIRIKLKICPRFVFNKTRHIDLLQSTNLKAHTVTTMKKSFKFQL